MIAHLSEQIKQDKHKTRIKCVYNNLVKTEYNNTICIYNSSYMLLRLHNIFCAIQSYQVEFIKKPNLYVAVSEYGLYNPNKISILK
jgi:hypothetical protein